jgi:hypothetical protein
MPRGGFTAAPGVAAELWLKQKELIAGRVRRSEISEEEVTASAQQRQGAASPGLAGGVVDVSNQMADGVGGQFNNNGLVNGGNGWTNGSRLHQQSQVPLQQQLVNQQYHNLGLGLTSSAAVTSSVPSPVDIQSLIIRKGWNPTTFDTQPKSARYARIFSFGLSWCIMSQRLWNDRFFVIKSFTEDVSFLILLLVSPKTGVDLISPNKQDVHKSLKYDIWSSTNLGNKRLDRAFRESASSGPIYLFFRYVVWMFHGDSFDAYCGEWQRQWKRLL